MQVWAFLIMCISIKIFVPGMRENPAVLRFKKLLLDEVLLV